MQTILLFHDAPDTPGLHATLSALGYSVLAEIADAEALHTHVAGLSPDLILAAVDTPSEKLLRSLEALSATRPLPVVMFARDTARETIRKAVGCGVHAYVVDGWAPERIASIIEAAAARFDAYQAVHKELASTRAKLAERKLIEKAKGIVMEQRRLSEEQAYTALRKMAMDQNLALAEVARRVIAVAQLLA